MNAFTIRSFVRRSGRVTLAQQRALETLWPRYGVTTSKNSLNLEELFGRTAAKHLEIGFGMGDTLVAMAKTHPEYDYLGIDVYRPGVGRLLLQLEAQQLTNVRVCCADAVEVLQYQITASSLDSVYIFFPDPWPKKRHHKRRLVQAELVKLLAQRLKSGGYLYLATDWQDYAEQMLAVLEASLDFKNSMVTHEFAPVALPIERPLTKFEQRGLRLGNQVWNLLYQRQ
jgi:tRNA (guanine-N7-)-methyltransferase